MLTIDSDSRQAWVGGSLIDLTWTEFEILTLLASTPRKCFSKFTIARGVWGRNYFDDGHAIESHVSRLRRKLREQDPGQPWITTVRRVGYRLEAAVTWVPRTEAPTADHTSGPLRIASYM